MKQENSRDNSNSSGMPHARRDTHREKPSDFVQGVLLFIAFVVFMGLWLYFNLPTS